ncbi:MAG: hypothetical protein NXH82_13535 [Rhodobacteraceae bacterium]|nr:hypothetical protein [Paracoccaceae bacterium]
MIVIAPNRVMNPAALETRNVPKRMLGRIAVLPRGAGWRVWLRLAFEIQLLRFLVPLIPFVVAMIVWPHLALPISQAPIPMMLVIGLVETQVLSLSPERRRAMLSAQEADRIRDAFRFNARRVLTRIAAHRDLREGELHLVVEQSLLARVRPLTLVSLQQAEPRARVLDVDATEQAIIATLFSEGLDAAALHRLALCENEALRQTVLDPAAVSAHARMAARMAAS